MNTELPAEGQVVQVKIGAGAFQPATYRRGQFVDLYGLTLDRGKVSVWQPLGDYIRASLAEQAASRAR
jgi:hypothetical protein